MESDSKKMGVRHSERNKRRIDYAALHESHTIQERNVHPHRVYFEEFEKNFKTKTGLEEVIHLVDEVRGEEFNDGDLKKLIDETRLLKPILVRGANPNVKETYNPKIKLSFHIPNYTMDELTEKIGPERKVPVMDVMTQNNSPRWNMKGWCEYFKLDASERDKIRNVISLEISDTQLGAEIVVPKVVSELDIILKLFQEEEGGLSQLLHSNNIIQPKVQKYVLMSVAGSYTDFHIDFAGTSVYYCPVSGHKKFILIPPLDRNLEVYKKWCLSDNQNSTWFPSLLKNLSAAETSRLKQDETVPGCYINNGCVIDILPGDLLLLPSMWIHAVYTEQDSVIVGGNYLNLLSLQNHLQTYKIEIDTKVDEQFRFPNFVKFVWLIAYYLMGRTASPSPGPYDAKCCRNLLRFLEQQWQFINSRPSSKRDKLLISKLKQALPRQIIGNVGLFLTQFSKWVDSSALPAADDPPDRQSSKRQRRL